MKKLIAWLSKGSKITKILKYIYKALIIANGVVGGGAQGAEEAGISQDVTEKISTTKKYIEVAIEYLGVILGWLGVSSTERDAIARDAEKETPVQLRDKCEEIVG